MWKKYIVLEIQIYEIWDLTINRQNNIRNMQYVLFIFPLPRLPLNFSMSTKESRTWTNSQSWNTKKLEPRTKSMETLSLSLTSRHFALTLSQEIPNSEPNFKSEDRWTVSWCPDHPTDIHIQTFILAFWPSLISLYFFSTISASKWSNWLQKHWVTSLLQEV